MDKTFEVWHRDVPSFRDNDIDILAELFPAGFTKVADVETDHIGRVFELTNHIDRDWTENPEVTIAAMNKPNRGYRSTSVGDVIADGNDRYTIDGMGMRKF